MAFIISRSFKSFHVYWLSYFLTAHQKSYCTQNYSHLHKIILFVIYHDVAAIFCIISILPYWIFMFVLFAVIFKLEFFFFRSSSENRFFFLNLKDSMTKSILKTKCLRLLPYLGSLVPQNI